MPFLALPRACQARELPLVIDADGLWLIERLPQLVAGELGPPAAFAAREMQAMGGGVGFLIFE